MGRITVSVNEDSVSRLKEVQVKLYDEMGVEFSMSQVIDFLVKQYLKENDDE
jgi:hypothetical protein